MKTIGKALMCIVYYFVIIWQDIRDYVDEEYKELQEEARDEAG